MRHYRSSRQAGIRPSLIFGKILQWAKFMFPPHAEFFNILSTHDPQHPRGSKERGGGRLISIYYVDHPPTPQLSLIQGMSTGYTPLITLLLCYRWLVV